MRPEILECLITGPGTATETGLFLKAFDLLIDEFKREFHQILPKWL